MKVNKPTLFFILIAILGIGGLYYIAFSSSKSEHPSFTYKDPYFNEVKKVFDTRCVACHACFNSPCQLNLTSYEGITRGASKMDPYKFPLLEPNPPTRLGIDAQSEKEWRSKGFFSVLNSSSKSKPDDIKDSILLELIHLAPLSVSETLDFNAEKSRICPSNSLSKDYLAKHTMPFGLPRLEEDQIQSLTKWVMSGAPGPNAEVTTYLNEVHDVNIKKEIIEWEEILNRKGYKPQLSARYFYEHLFSAHVSFRNDKNEFFRIVRAKNLEGAPDEIATVRPFDDPKTKDFYYRFKKINETIAFKTHTVFALNGDKLKRFHKDFLNSNWNTHNSTLPGYSAEAANAFLVFKDIPSESRYRFFLENARYFIMTFIKGPVCRGQTALNVINDHFWVMFLDPKYDVTVSDPYYFQDVTHLLSPPASEKNNFDLFNKTKDNRWQAAMIKTKKLKKSGLVLSEKAIWNGYENKPDPNALLTVYRHFDSASVVYGAQGTIPKTIWVMDYQIFEDIYYNLVAGYNVFGPVLHQINTRLYMDISRIESEDMFINFMPQHSRSAMRQDWSKYFPSKSKNLGEEIFSSLAKDVIKDIKFDYKYAGGKIKSDFVAKTVNPKTEFLKILATKRFSDSSFYQSPDLRRKQSESLKVDLDGFKLSEATIKALNSINGVTGEFVKYFPDVSFLKLQNTQGKFKMFSIIRNKFHYNVSMMFFENQRLNPSKDTLDILPIYAASYPNYFFELDEERFQKMVHQLLNEKNPNEYCQTLRYFGVPRTNPSFWKIYDWFSDDIREKEPVEGGVLDLNRYVAACKYEQ